MSFSLFSRIQGRFNTLAPFYIMSGTQESITGNGALSLGCFHSKLYTTDEPITLSLNNGYQDGQLKKLTFVHKGNDKSNVVVEIPALTDNYSQIIFSSPGDTATLQWTGGYWTVIETLNTTDPSLCPVVE